MRKPLTVIAGLALLASGAFAGLAGAADHRDSPSNVADAAADATDIYAFRSPANQDNIVVALDVVPLIAPSDNATRLLDPAVSYQIDVSNKGDVQPEAIVKMTVSPDGKTLNITGLTSGVLAVPVTQPAQSPQITASGAIRAFLGQRDDPFFFDLVGFQNFLAKPAAPVAGLRTAGGGTPADTFAGTNIWSIVLELPVTSLTGGSSSNTGTIQVVARVLRGTNQIDRISIPAVNTALVPSDLKNSFNAARDERQDMANFGPAVTNTINGLRGVVDGLFGPSAPQDGGPLGNLSSAQVTGALLPYVVTIDFSKPLQFPNGRRLQDDVIDTALGLVLNRGGAAGVSDGVSGNDKPFLASFPYLAEPHTGSAAAQSAPSQPGAGSTGTAVRPPNTGDGGLLDDSGTMWALSGGMFLLAVTFGGAAVFATMRGRGR